MLQLNNKKTKTMRRALFIAIIAFAAVSCNNSGSSSGSTDSTTTTTTTDTMTGTGTGTGSGTGTGADTGTMNESRMGGDTAGRNGRDSLRH